MHEKIKSEARIAALRNAAQFGGKASARAVLGSILGKVPESRTDIKATTRIVDEIVSEINSMSLVEQKKEIDRQKIDTSKEKKEKEGLKELPGASKTVVMRFAPNPNGPLSLGHSRQALLNWFYVKRYNGRYILRLDDTDPKIKTPLKEAYVWIKKDLEWLGIKPDLAVRASSRFSIYYEHAEKLIDMGHAYVCTCAQQVFSDLKRKGLACPCRSLDPSENKLRWKKMFSVYREGEAVLRIKTDIIHRNPAIRDWPAARIVEKPIHPYVNYRVWPLYDFASALDDHLLGVTHIIRGIDFLATKEKQGYIYDYFGWSYPKDLVTGKLIVEGVKSTSTARKLIESGALAGWDDPRLGTLMSLRRRGFSPEAIREFVLDIGLKKSDVKVSEKNLYAYNKKIIDPLSPRYFFAQDPVVIDISKSKKSGSKITIKAPVQSQKNRELRVGTKIYVSKTDYDKYRGKKVRLKELSYGTLGKTFAPAPDEDKYSSHDGIQVIQWVPVQESIDTEIIMPDSTVLRGKAESSIKGLDNMVVQFERVGFVNLGKGRKKITAYFTHP